jgi:hypothetical protein|tara:strand:+ start:3581 stop:3757 length:177 start_codon:yes stop_codon:yes gene_type:complete
MENFMDWLNRVLGVRSNTDLTKMTKVELENLGRENGIELDRRFKRQTLVKQLRKKLGE